jgi:hypothetical protein
MALFDVDLAQLWRSLTNCAKSHPLIGTVQDNQRHGEVLTRLTCCNGDAGHLAMRIPGLLGAVVQAVYGFGELP